MLQPDHRLNLAERQRVRLTVQPVSNLEATDRQAARDRLLIRLKKSTLAFGGTLPNREDLYDRDR